MKKIFLKIISIVGAFSAVLTAVISFAVINKKTSINSSPVNKSMYPVVGFNTTPVKYDSSDIRIANWNLKNFVGKKNKVDSLAKLVVDQKIALLGAEEVDKVSALYDLSNKLNTMTQNNPWKVVASKLAKDGIFEKNKYPESGVGAWEYYGFIYNSKLFTPKPFNDHKVGEIYSNPFEKNKYLDDMPEAKNKMSAFVRPPFGVEFQFKNGKDFTAVIAHLDSPKAGKAKSGHAVVKNYSSNSKFKTFEGALSSRSSANNYGTSVGTQELFEAEKVEEAMKWFDKKSGNDKDLIFMGDTNIPHLKNGTPFQNLIDDGYDRAFNPDETSSNSSLSQTAKTFDPNYTHKGRLFVNPYDKIFIKSPLWKHDSNKLDIKHAFDVLGMSGNPGEFAKTVTDHTMVWVTFDFTKKDSGHSSMNVEKSNNDRKMDLNNMSYYELVSVAGLKEQEAAKIIFYRNINEAINATNIKEILNYYIKGGVKFDRVKELQEKYNLKFTYGTLKTKSKEVFRKVNDFRHSAGVELKMQKIDINSATYSELVANVKMGVISQKTLELAMKLRSKGKKINSANDFGGKYPISKIDDKLLDYSKPSIKIENPLDINSASAKSMIDGLVGYDNSLYSLSEYHIWAMLSYRTNVGAIDTYEKLKKIVGSYAATKLGYNVIYKSPVQKVTGLDKKININKVDSTEMNKYLGEKLGSKVYAYIYAKAQKDKQHKGIDTFDELKNIDKKYYYWFNQLKEIFTIDVSDTVFKDVVQENNKPIAKRYDFNKMKSTSNIKDLQKLILDAVPKNIQATNVAFQYFVKNRTSKTFLKNLIKAMDASNDWNETLNNFHYKYTGKKSAVIGKEQEILKIIAPQ